MITQAEVRRFLAIVNDEEQENFKYEASNLAERIMRSTDHCDLQNLIEYAHMLAAMSDEEFIFWKLQQ